MKKTIMAIIALLPLLLLVSSCNSEPPYLFGPPFPEHGANKYLKSQGVSPETIDKIIKLEDMPQEDFEKYSRSDNMDVRFQIALNPHTPSNILEILARDNKWFVREGVAINRSIDAKLIDMLKNDKDSGVWEALVGNPSVPEDVILWIYENHDKRYLNFYATNPKCPESIKNDIRKSNDRFAKDLLKMTEDKVANPDKNSPCRCDKANNGEHDKQALPSSQSDGKP